MLPGRPSSTLFLPPVTIPHSPATLPPPHLRRHRRSPEHSPPDPHMERASSSPQTLTRVSDAGHPRQGVCPPTIPVREKSRNGARYGRPSFPSIGGDPIFTLGLMVCNKTFTCQEFPGISSDALRERVPKEFVVTCITNGFCPQLQLRRKVW